MARHGRRIAILLLALSGACSVFSGLDAWEVTEVPGAGLLGVGIWPLLAAGWIVFSSARQAESKARQAESKARQDLKALSPRHDRTARGMTGRRRSAA